MKLSSSHHFERRTRAGVTFLEMLITITLGAVSLSMVMGVYLFAARGVGVMCQQTQVDIKSQQGVERMLREIREANLVVSYKTNSPITTLTVANTLASPPVTNTFTWYPSTSELNWDRPGQPTQTLLTGCDYWGFVFHVRAPDANGVFKSTSDASTCKLLNISWRCSRPNIVKNMNPDSMLTAQVVLRNKI